MIRTAIIRVYRLFEAELVLILPAERLAWSAPAPDAFPAAPVRITRHRKMTWKYVVPG